MKSLFSEKESYTDTANEFAKEIHDAIFSILEKYSNNYSIKDLRIVAEDTIKSDTLYLTIKKYRRRNL